MSPAYLVEVVRERTIIAEFWDEITCNEAKEKNMAPRAKRVNKDEIVVKPIVKPIDKPKPKVKRNETTTVKQTKVKDKGVSCNANHPNQRL